jgi:hypothetical protein
VAKEGLVHANLVEQSCDDQIVLLSLDVQLGDETAQVRDVRCCRRQKIAHLIVC